MLENPYVLDKIETKTVYGPIDANDYAFVKGVHPQTGAWSAIVGHLCKKLIYELKRQGIRDFSRTDEFEDLITNCRVISNVEYDTLTVDSANWQRELVRRGLPNGTISGSVSTSPTLVGGSTAPTDNPDSSTPPITPNMESGNRTGSKAKRKHTQSTKENKP